MNYTFSLKDFFFIIWKCKIVCLFSIEDCLVVCLLPAIFSRSYFQDHYYFKFILNRLKPKNNLLRLSAYLLSNSLSGAKHNKYVVNLSMSSKLLDSQHALGTWLPEVLISKKFLKNIYGQRKNKMETKSVLTVNCYRMPSASNYVILFVSTVKLNLSKFWVIISCQGNAEIRVSSQIRVLTLISLRKILHWSCASDPTHAHEGNHVIIYFVLTPKFKPVSENILPASFLRKMS